MGLCSVHLMFLSEFRIRIIVNASVGRVLDHHKLASCSPCDQNTCLTVACLGCLSPHKVVVFRANDGFKFSLHQHIDRERGPTFPLTHYILPGYSSSRMYVALLEPQSLHRQRLQVNKAAFSCIRIRSFWWPGKIASYFIIIEYIFRNWHIL